MVDRLALHAGAGNQLEDHREHDSIRRMRAQPAVGCDLVGAVDRLARTTGSDPVPPGKIMRGYRHEKDKFDLAA